MGNINVTISGDVGIFLPALPDEPEKIRELIGMFGKLFGKESCGEEKAVMDFLRDFLDGLEENEEGEEDEVDEEDVWVLMVEPGKATRKMRLGAALEELESEQRHHFEAVVQVVPTYDAKMYYNGRRVISLGSDKYLYGKAIIFDTLYDDDEFISLKSSEMTDLIRIFEMLTVTLSADGQDFKAFHL